MRKINRQLVDMLHTWGAWSAEGVRGLGFPSCTAEARLYTSPGRAQGCKPSVPTYPIDPIARRVDIAMRECKPDTQRILHLVYVNRLDVSQMRRMLGLQSRGATRWQIELAHRPIAEALRVSTY